MAKRAERLVTPSSAAASRAHLDEALANGLHRAAADVQSGGTSSGVVLLAGVVGEVGDRLVNRHGVADGLPLEPKVFELAQKQVRGALADEQPQLPLREASRAGGRPEERSPWLRRRWPSPSGLHVALHATAWACLVSSCVSLRSGGVQRFAGNSTHPLKPRDQHETSIRGATPNRIPKLTSPASSGTAVTNQVHAYDVRGELVGKRSGSNRHEMRTKVFRLMGTSVAGASTSR